MKKKICLFFLGFSSIALSQEIEKMSKKELLVAYKNLKLSKQNMKDSLLIKLDEVNFTTKNQIKEKELKIKALENKLELKDQEIKKLSIKPLKLDYFSEIPKEFQKKIDMIYSENKDLYRIKRYSILEDKDEKIILLYIDNKPVYLYYKEKKESPDSDIPDSFFSNDHLTLKIGKLEPADDGDEVTFIYTAEITIIDNYGQILKFNVYGQSQ